MTNNASYILGFALTVAGACLLWFLGASAYKRHQKRASNRMLALSFLFTGLWLLCGFVDKLFDPPNINVTLWSFRLAYLFGNTGLLFSFLFVYTLSPEATVRPRIRNVCVTLGALNAVTAVSPLGVAGVDVSGPNLTMLPGKLFPVIAMTFLLSSVACVIEAHRKARAYRGIDRARAEALRWFLFLILLIIAVFTYLLPALTGNGDFVYVTFFAGAFVPVFFFYIIVRYHLLEMRIIIRKTGLGLIAALLFSLPIAALFALFHYLQPSIPMMALTTTVVLMPLFTLAPRIWEWLRTLSARLFFSGLYDAAKLESEASNEWFRKKDHAEGILSGLERVVAALGLRSIEVRTYPQVVGEKSLRLGVFRDDALEMRYRNEYSDAALEWLGEAERIAHLTEKLCREASSTESKELGKQLRAMGVAAIIPCDTPNLAVGWLLVGEKISGEALSTTDMRFLERLSQRLALYLGDYAMSLALRAKVAELKAANMYKQEIIMLMAHEFCTPITVANGMTQLLMGDAALTEEDWQACLSWLQGAVQRLQELVDQAFRISAHQEGALHPTKRRMELPALLNRLYEAYPKKQKQRLKFDFPPDGSPVLTDAEYLFIILKAVIDNALNFSQNGSPVNVHAAEKVGGLVFTVQDFGEGIPSEKLPTIFDPFTRARELDHHSKGAGLGLYIAKLYADQLNIDIRVESQVGEGTTVTVWVPCAPAVKNSNR
ncbi:MAG: hypothetical protein H5T74_11025 [Actinobacteria bacterium]|nr:hypothetical protein [Actinomycetota bacterium]